MIVADPWEPLSLVHSGYSMRRRIKTGIAIELPPESEGQIRSRSGLADQYGVVVFNSPGTVDEGFRGEIEVILANFGEASFHVQKGNKIAQLVIASVQFLEVHEVELLTDTQRRKSGFGSSGK